MTPTQKESILALIEKAREVREESLSRENSKAMGYPYYSGYATSTLDNIAKILEEAE